MFIGTCNSKTDGAFLINKAGALISINIDENNLVSYIMNNCSQIDGKSVRIQLAQKYGLPGADGMFVELFNRAIISQDYTKAA